MAKVTKAMVDAYEKVTGVLDKYGRVSEASKRTRHSTKIRNGKTRHAEAASSRGALGIE